MISVRFEKSEEAMTMEVIGHAGFAEMGKDPVCAGASMLAMTAAQCVKCMEEAGRLQKRAHIVIRNGRVLVTAKSKAEYMQETRHLFWVAETGMRLLAETYPGNIEIQSVG